MTRIALFTVGALTALTFVPARSEAQGMPQYGQFGDAVDDDERRELERQQRERAQHGTTPTGPQTAHGNSLEAGEAQMGLDHPEDTRDAFTIDGENERPPTSSSGHDAAQPGLVRLGRSIVELGGFAAGAIVGGLGGGLIGLPFVYLAELGGSDAHRFLPAFVGAGIGGVVLAPLGVWLAGNAMRGDGKLVWTYVGSAGLGLLTFGISAAAGADRGVAGALGVVGLAVGGILTYEITSHTDRTTVQSQSDAHLSLGVAPTLGGAAVLASGTF